MTQYSKNIRTGLTELQRQQFLRDGFIKLSGLASPDVLRDINQVVDASMEPALGPLEYEADVQYQGAPADRLVSGGDTPRRLLNAYARDEVFRDWACAPAVVKVVKQLIGTDEVRLTQNHHNCIMTKLPVFSSQTDWHQDIRYWSFDRPELVNVWLALGNEHVENGGMKMIPGSHTMEFERGRLDANLFLRQDLPENQNLLETAVDVELEAGDVLFFHCRTFHAAGANTTNRPKYSLVFSYHAADNLPIPETRSARLDSVSID
ncbi:MAG: phytanoyl-CoA dioxygenase family protein [Cycloclasticus sp.]